MTKKKFTHILLSLLMVLPLFLSFFSGVKTALAAETNDTQSIMLHKRIFRDRDQIGKYDGELHQNTGEEITLDNDATLRNNDGTTMQMLADSLGLNEATFALLEVTDYYYELATDSSYEEAQAQLIEEFDRKTAAGWELGSSHDGATVVDIQTTTDRDGEAGIAIFADVPKVVNDRDAAYLIVETAVGENSNVDVDTTKLASSMFLSFPVIVDGTDNVEFSGEYIHLYPKNLGYVRDPWFMKLSRNLNGDVAALEGVEFVFYKVNEETDERLYFIPDHANPDIPENHQWVSVELDEQGNAIYDDLVAQGIEIYTSNEFGIVSMNGAVVPSGTYYFEEVKSAENYVITADSRSIPVVIPSSLNATDPVLVNDIPMVKPEPDWSALGEDKSLANILALIGIEALGDYGLPYVFNDEDIDAEKELVEDRQDFAVGEAIQYRMTTVIPFNPAEYEYIRLVDKTDGTLQLLPSSIKVRLGDATEYLSAAEVAALMTITPAENNAGFTAELNLDYLKSDEVDYAGELLTIDYQMVITEEAVADTALINEGSLEYSHNGYEYSKETDKPVVYTGGHRFIKVDLDDAKKTLTGAKFVILNSDNKYLALVDGAVTWVDKQADAKVLTSDNAGEFAIQGLNYGTYQLKEIVAPNGYQLLSSPVSFTVEQGSYLVDGVAASQLAVANVKEKPTVPGLPQTGESSVSWMMGLGVLVLAAAAAIYTMKKKEGSTK